MYTFNVDWLQLLSCCCSYERHLLHTQPASVTRYCLAVALGRLPSKVILLYMRCMSCTFAAAAAAAAASCCLSFAATCCLGGWLLGRVVEAVKQHLM